MRKLGRPVLALAGIVAVAVFAVVAVDAWRASSAHPQNCASLLLEPARGDLVADTAVQRRAWAALTDPAVETVGSLGGSEPSLNRSCLLYAGRIAPGEDPTVVFAETTVTGYTDLLRIAEVQVGDPTSMRATAGYPVQLGAELGAGIVLPLSGRYLAPDDVTAVTVVPGTGAPAHPAVALAAGTFQLGVVPDRSLAPADQVPDIPASLLLQRTGTGRPTMLALPVVAASAGPPVRVPLAVTISAEPTADQTAQPAVLAVLPLFYADPKLPAVLQRAPERPQLAVRTAVIPGGHGVVVAAGEPAPAPGVPVFSYFVPTGGGAVVVPK